MENSPKIIAVDFDGTLAESAWPDIGRPIQSVIDALKAEQAAGCRTILWTSRCGDRLEAAVAWCAEQGIQLDAVNENLPEVLAFYGSDCRKVFADEYWDDRARRMPEAETQAPGGASQISGLLAADKAEFDAIFSAQRRASNITKEGY